MIAGRFILVAQQQPRWTSSKQFLEQWTHFDQLLITVHFLGFFGWKASGPTLYYGESSFIRAVNNASALTSSFEVGCDWNHHGTSLMLNRLPGGKEGGRGEGSDKLVYVAKIDSIRRWRHSSQSGRTEWAQHSDMRCRLVPQLAGVCLVGALLGSDWLSRFHLPMCPSSRLMPTNLTWLKESVKFSFITGTPKP